MDIFFNLIIKPIVNKYQQLILKNKSSGFGEELDISKASTKLNSSAPLAGRINNMISHMKTVK